MMTTMTLDDFEVRAMAYGADIDLWPAEDRAGARALLAESDDAKAMLDEARALDATLDLWDAPQPSAALIANVLADAGSVAGEAAAAQPSIPARPAKQGWAASLFGTVGFLRPGLALAACLALGVVMGTTLEQDVLSPEPVTVVTGEINVIDFAFAMEDDADLLLGSEALL